MENRRNENCAISLLARTWHLTDICRFIIIYIFSDMLEHVCRVSSVVCRMSYVCVSYLFYFNAHTHKTLATDKVKVYFCFIY